ncbi:uncharacterized protein LOC108113972 isoform X2 [Drosophila eugracilis]|uniref:uncharacterized protein LOC108113972 isoform X2 n=1 Tax=Drosophila eugracilis TaxID=29029 RepID=UPI0007E69A7D|nr:uncharacterized protein LOC108113972 isoform X2 [Drosophila eugracilis]
MYMYKILVVFLAVFMIDKRCLGTSAPSYLAKAQEINAIRLSEEWPRLSVSSKLNRDCKEYARHLATLNIPDQTLYWTNEVDEFGNKDVIITDHIAYPSSDPKNTNYIESICEFVNESCALYWYSKGGLFFRNHLKFPSKIEQSLAGKYTAMLWKSSKKIGVGIALKNRIKIRGT